MAKQTKTEHEPQRFSIEEVGQVIRSASALSLREAGELASSEAPGGGSSLNFEELSHLAGELGISDQLLRKAIPLAAAQRQRAEKRTLQKMRFWRHLLVYLPVMGGLGLLDFLGGGGYWVQIPAIFWGIFLAMHGLRAFVTSKQGRLHRAILEQELAAERQSGFVSE